MDNINIRKAQAIDSKDIIEINIKTWNTTYEGIIPKEILKSRENRKEEMIKKCEKTVEIKDNVLVAEYDNKVVGVVSYGKAKAIQNNDYGEIYSMYVLDNYQGKNIGKKLFLEAKEELIGRGYTKIVLTCIKENNSNGFYQKMGGRIDKVILSNIEGVKLEENVIIFDKIRPKPYFIKNEHIMLLILFKIRKFKLNRYS